MQILIQDIYIRGICSDTYRSIDLLYNILYLQKKIYQAAQECHQSLVHSLQKLLISLYSANKVASNIAKKKVLSKKMCINYDKNDILTQDPNVVRETNKILILWCLEPEWQPKIQSCNMADRFSRAEALDKLSQSYYPIERRISLKHLNTQYLYNKLKSIKWITQNIKHCFETQCFIQTINSTSVKNTFSYLGIDLLYNLVKFILFTGVDWLYFRQSISVIGRCIYKQLYLSFFRQNICVCGSYKLLLSISKIFTSFYTHTSLTGIQLKNKNLWTFRVIDVESLTADFEINLLVSDIRNKFYKEISQLLFYNIRNILFHKDRFGRTRTNQSVSTSKIGLLLQTLISQWGKSYYSINDNHLIDHIDDSVNEIIYLWNKKKYKNQTINGIKYFCNVRIILAKNSSR
jgi:hypothetical protein